MRFKFTLLLLALLTLSAIPLSARDFTYTYAGQTLTYTVISETDRTCKTADGYDDNGSYIAGNNVSGSLQIPSIAKDGNMEYSVVEIGYYAFYNSNDLISVTIPNSVITIGNYAFSFCKGLIRITIPSSVTQISDCAFFWCSGLTSVDIPSSVTTIGDHVFYQCKSLAHVGIPSSVTIIGDFAFGGCTTLTGLTIPSSVITIGKGAFSTCTGLTIINIPNSVTTIEDMAFAQCWSLTDINIPSSVSFIGALAFGDCYSLVEINIPSSVTTIGKLTFNCCRSLESVRLGKEMTNIGYSAFGACRAIEDVYCAAIIPPTADPDSFEYIQLSKVSLHVPFGSKNAYAEAEVWKDFGYIVEEDMDGIEKVEDDELYDGVDYALPYQVFDLKGKFLGNSTESLAPGIYILRQGSIVMKIAIN